MRIICDHCDRQISGTVKVLAGTLNLHPDCMTELGKDTKREVSTVSWQCQNPRASRWTETRRQPAYDAG